MGLVPGLSGLRCLGFGFPCYGKLFGESSTLWKIFGRIFHAMEDYLPHCGKTGPNLPRYGRFLGESSTLWKIFFHTVEKQALFFHAMVPPPKSKVGDNGFAARLRRRRTLRANAQRLRLGPQKVPLRQHSELRFQIDSQTDPFLAFLLRLSPPFWLCGTSRRRHGRRSIPLFSAA